MTIVGFLGYGLVVREQSVRERWDALPAANLGDLTSIQGRLDAIEGLLGKEHYWGGVFQAWRERDELRSRIVRLQEDAARAERTAALQKQERLQNAEDMRLRGMLSVKSGRFAEGLVALRQALEFGGEHWEQRQRVLNDISAIEAWKVKQP
jgi:DNA-binding transcriptional regulator YiaG